MRTTTIEKSPAGLTHVQKACAYIEEHADASITLADLAAHVQASPFHLQRTFTRIVGISPREYRAAVRAGRFRQVLRNGVPVAGATYDAGYGSSSRVYEGRPTGRGMTPAVYRRGGRDTTVSYTTVASPLGRLLVAATAQGICSVKLGEADPRLEEDLRREYPAATIARADATLREWVSAILAHLKGQAPHLHLPLDIQATAFQWKVWRYLQSIPYGETRAYSDVARAIGAPKSVRAVARACATNPVCLVIPCHRVVQKGGGLGGYRWGTDRKQRLLKRERSR